MDNERRNVFSMRSTRADTVKTYNVPEKKIFITTDNDFTCKISIFEQNRAIYMNIIYSGDKHSVLRK